MNVSVAIQDQLKTIEVSELISCIASICHVYMKFGNIAKSWKNRKNIGI
jgi:hypothetical protein